MNKIIEIKHLKKYFKDIKAVDDISFNVKKGELFAFLGVNGAGKSTTINILVGVLKKDAGECYIEEQSIENIEKILPHIGIVFQNSLLDKKLTVYDNLKYRAICYELDEETFDKNLNYLCQNLDLTPLLKRPLDKLSGGQKRKVDIARALIHMPNILILDEPTTGLDPMTRRLVWDLVDKLQKERNLTVILTTHYMEEASNAHFVVIIDNGKIVAEGSPIQLKNAYAFDYLKLYDYDKKIIEILNEEKIIYKIAPTHLEVSFKDTASAKEFIAKNKDLIFDLEIVKGTMDDVFLNVTGKDLKQI